MDGWVGGWMDGRMEKVGWMDGWMDEWVGGWMNGWRRGDEGWRGREGEREAAGERERRKHRDRETEQQSDRSLYRQDGRHTILWGIRRGLQGLGDVRRLGDWQGVGDVCLYVWLYECMHACVCMYVYA
eukprot:2481147-Rhodomonas_salina.5